MAEHAEKEKKPIYKKWWFWVIIVVLVIGIAGAGSSSNNTQQTSSNTTTNQQQSPEETIEYTAVTVDQLEEALSNNAAAAKETYDNKYLEITGRLGTIDADLQYISLLSTTNEFDLVGVHCSIKNEEQKNIVKTLSKDDTITVKGKITNVGEVLGYYLDITEIVK